MNVTIDDHTPFIMSAKERAIHRGLEKIGLLGEGYAKVRITKLVYDQPEHGYKRTGRLRNSITHRVIGKNAVAIGTNVEYGKYIEKGTSKMTARPYLEPAIKEHIDLYRDILYTELMFSEFGL